MNNSLPVSFNSQIADGYQLVFFSPSLILRSSNIPHLKNWKKAMLISSYSSKFGLNLKYFCSPRCLMCGQDWRLCKSA